MCVGAKAEKRRPRATSVTNHGPAPLPSPTAALRHFRCSYIKRLHRATARRPEPPTHRNAPRHFRITFSPNTKNTKNIAKKKMNRKIRRRRRAWP